MKKKIIFFIIVFVVLIGCGLVFLVKQSKTKNPELPTTPSERPIRPIGMPNPASVFCEKEGGKIEIRKDKEGNEQGFCLFEDGSECDEWAFYRGECKKGERFCKDLCGDGFCQEIVCMAIGCPCSETKDSCPEDCRE